MARPERNNVDYFPYLVDEGEKMYYIDQQYGNDGYATFIKILTSLAKTDFHFLDLSKKTTQMFLSAKCKVSTEVLLNIITDLAELGKFDLMLWNESKVIWCQDFIDSIQDAYKKRNNDCISFEGLLILLDSLGVRKLSKLPTKVSVKPQSKVEYIKEDKIKEDYDLNFIEDIDFRTLFLRWINYKKERKEKYKTEDSLKTAFEKLKKYSGGEILKATQIIENSIGMNYAGFFELKSNNFQNGNQNTNTLKSNNGTYNAKDFGKL